MMKKYFLMLLLVSIFLISGCGSEKKSYSERNWNPVR